MESVQNIAMENRGMDPVHYRLYIDVFAKRATFSWMKTMTVGASKYKTVIEASEFEQIKFSSYLLNTYE